MYIYIYEYIYLYLTYVFVCFFLLVCFGDWGSSLQGLAVHGSNIVNKYHKNGHRMENESTIRNQAVKKYLHQMGSSPPPRWRPTKLPFPFEVSVVL